MRVISGRRKGRVLYSPQGRFIRPTSEKIKKFIFDYVGESVQDAVILDLYSGTGNLSIEALSRGAKFAVLLDNSAKAIQLIYRNLELTNFLAQSRIVRQDALRYLKKAIQQKNQFNLIFADPPYFVNSYQNVIEYAGRDDLLQKGGFFILEHSSKDKVDASSTVLTLEKTKIFGDTAVSVFKKKGS
jgi:16S rRNA (guanine966-N2)-methyltransferase